MIQGYRRKLGLPLGIRSFSLMGLSTELGFESWFSGIAPLAKG
jgi:hypothetical protein